MIDVIMLCIYHTNTKLDTSCIFRRTGPPPQLVNLNPDVGVQVSFPRVEPSSETELRVNNIAVVNFLLSCPPQLQ